MFRSTVSALSLVAIALLPACASTNKVTENQSSSDYVTSVEIDRTPASTAYDLVSRLRPNWLRQGGISSMSGGRLSGQMTLVYLDGNKMGDLTSLRSIAATGLAKMQWYDAARAQTVLRGIGTEPIAGAIVITSTTR